MHIVLTNTEVSSCRTDSELLQNLPVWQMG